MRTRVMFDDGWRDKAACRSAPPGVFFPEGDNWRELARPAAHTWCSQCEVADECLGWAIRAKIPYGLWGGRFLGGRTYAA